MMLRPRGRAPGTTTTPLGAAAICWRRRAGSARGLTSGGGTHAATALLEFARSGVSSLVQVGVLLHGRPLGFGPQTHGTLADLGADGRAPWPLPPGLLSCCSGIGHCCAYWADSGAAICRWRGLDLGACQCRPCAISHYGQDTCCSAPPGACSSAPFVGSPPAFDELDVASIDTGAVAPARSSTGGKPPLQDSPPCGQDPPHP
jgi:hypothetical protein